MKISITVKMLPSYSPRATHISSILIPQGIAPAPGQAQGGAQLQDEATLPGPHASLPAAQGSSVPIPGGSSCPQGGAIQSGLSLYLILSLMVFPASGPTTAHPDAAGGQLAHSRLLFCTLSVAAFGLHLLCLQRVLGPRPSGPHSQ